MKKTTTALFFLLLFSFILFCCSAALSETAQHQITVMVYMCGSNLESSYGSASADILEMLDANMNGQETGLLIMTGGSAADTGDFSSKASKVLEISGSRKRCVHEFDAMNMGEPETLSMFIRYCAENHPAEQYALILWDHGGGPLEGVCWDEAHDMDHLSISELTSALKEANLGQKLSWIGFDACLMSSLEVAGQLADYADYLIASQETEPSSGWNYSFLAGVENDPDGAETGRRIIDAYFEGSENNREILTMTCTDLSAASDIIQALNPVFQPLSKRLDKNQFRILSGLRMSTVGFGKAAPAEPDTGYDLVDVRDLVSKIERTEDTEAILNLLERAIVYNRSNVEGANGLTLYHPYFNKTDYTEKWKNDYQEITFSDGYQAYVDAFGSMLTGEILFRWLDLIPAPAQENEDGSFSFEMQLTEEQAENAVSAQLLIIQDILGNELDANCVLIASCNAEIGKDRIVRGTWNRQALYVESGKGKVAGPISYLQTDDGKTSTIIAHYTLKDDVQLNGQTVLFELDAADSSEYPEFTRIRVWDEATQSYSSRMAFSEDPYGSLLFANILRSFPGTDVDQALPPFEKWDNNTNTTVISSLDLPDTWKLHSLPLLSGHQTYALFRILDTQQNAVCSLPIRIPDSTLSVLDASSGAVESEQFRADLRCSINTSQENFGLQLEWELENRNAEKTEFRIMNPVINDIRIMNGSLDKYISPGETVRSTLNISRHDLSFIDRLESISGILEVTPEGKEKESVPFCFTFSSENFSALSGDAVVLSESEKEGISLKLLSVEDDDGIGWNIRILAKNSQDKETTFGKVLLNNVYISARMEAALPSGMERVYSVTESNEFLLGFSGNNYSMQMICAEENILQSMGFRELNSVTVLTSDNKKNPLIFDLPVRPPLSLELRQRSSEANLLYSESYPPEDLPVPDEEKLPILAENDLFRVRLRRLTAGDTRLSLLLEWTNLSDEWLRFRLNAAEINGQEAYIYEPVTLSPGATILSEALLDTAALNDSGQTVQEIVLSLFDEGRGSSDQAVRVTITPSEPVQTGQEDGIWINGDRFSVVPAHLENENFENNNNPKALEESLLVPDNPDSFRKNIEVPLDSEALKQVDFVRMTVLREDEENFWQIVSLNDAKPDGSEKLLIAHPGLFTTIAGAPEICVTTQFSSVDSDTLKGSVISRINLLSNEFDYFNLEKIKWEMDRLSGVAVISEFEQDLAPYTYQMDIKSAEIYSYDVKITPREDGTLPHVVDCERRFYRSDKNPFKIKLNNQPLQLQLRPITPEDHLYVMISVKELDGSTWSLPLFPYPVS